MSGRPATFLLVTVLLGGVCGMSAAHALHAYQSSVQDQPLSEAERARLLAKGKELFVERCARCHNERGDKPLKTGPPLDEVCTPQFPGHRDGTVGAGGCELSDGGAHLLGHDVTGRLPVLEDERRAVTLFISSLMKTKGLESSGPKH